VGAAWLVAAGVQRAAGAALGALEAAGARAYQALVDPAPPNSWPVRTFRALALGPLRPVMLEFFAASGDFTRRLTDVRANAKFARPDASPADYWTGEPEDLAGVVASLRARHGVRHVIAWHSLSAYWGGVAPADGHPCVAKYSARVVRAAPTPGVAEVEPAMLWNPAVVAGVGVVDDPGALYADMHAYLAAAGVDGVKVDGQAGAGLLGSALEGGAATAARFQAALEASVATHLPGNHCAWGERGGAREREREGARSPRSRPTRPTLLPSSLSVTNCMCHSTENLFRTTASALVRASDDFYPRDPSSSGPHIGACAYNAVFLAGILHPDYDMFHSRHPAARAHAAARAVSGGPVYVSDAPGCHDFSILSTLVLPDGRVLRAKLPGRATADCLFRDVMRDGMTLLKIWNANPHALVVATLHVQGSAWCRVRRRFVTHDDAPPPLAGVVRPTDAGADPAGGGEWAAFTHGARAVRFLTDPKAGVDVVLEAGGAAVTTLAPVARPAGDTGPGLALVGLRGMLNAGGAIASLHVAATRGGAGLVAAADIIGGGDLIAWASAEPSSVTGGAAGGELPFSFDGATGTLVVAPPAGEADWGVRFEI
jgi:raffinose synthase